MPGSRAQGREREIGRLLSSFEGLAESGLRLALVEGPTGAGKRDVVRAFCDRARASGAVVLEGTCFAGRPHAPFEAIVDKAVADVAKLGIRGATSDDLACPDGCHALWFQHRGPSSGTRARDVALARRCLHGAVGALLDAIAALRPTVVALYGLEDADPESLELLAYLLEAAAGASGAQRLLIVATAREGSAPERVRQSSRTIRLRVDPLDREGLRALLASPELVQRVLASTGGLPAAVERLLATEPPSPDEHLARRIGAVGSEARAVFEALSVIDRPATAAELGLIAEIGSDDEVARAIAELAAVGLACEDARARIGFVDRDDAERVRSALSESALRAIARRCVEVCLRDASDPAEAARHALRAGLADEALALWEQAADALHARHADAMGAELLDRIAALAGEDAPVALHARLAELRMASGEFRLALRAARRVLAAAPADPAAARRVAEALVLAGDLPEAAQVVARARPLVDRETARELGATLAELLYQSGKLDEADATCREVLESGCSSDAELSAMQTRAKVALARGALDDADHLYVAYENRARALDDVRHEGLAIGGRGVTLLTRGALPEAEHALRRCARLAEDANDRKGQALAWHNLAVAAHLAHDYATARSRYEKALRFLRLVGNKSSLARCAYNLGELYESLGDSARARSMADFGAQVGGVGIAPRAEAEGLLLRGRVELGDGSAELARAAFEAARAILDRTDPVRGAAAIVGLARVALHDGRVDEAARLLEQTPAGVPPSRRADIALTRVALARARGGDTLPAAREAVRAADEANDDILRVESLVELAQATRDRGEHARAAEIAAKACELDARIGERVPDDLATAWDDRPTRRRLLSLRHAGARPERTSSPGLLAARDDRLVGSSPPIRRIHGIVARVGPSRCTVLVTGESGTGKELVAEAIHSRSPRKDGPLVRVNCAALVESLLVSELFGHEKGAFTGAHERKKGRFELADGGTIFLDEIGDISPSVQAALLRVLSERRFERVGGRESIEVDVRIVAATNRDLEAMVRAGTFREDLYYRLNEVRIEMPPLRDRASDVPLLCDHLLGRVAEERGEPKKRLSTEALALLESQRWPGNVRQLENALRVGSLFADGEVVEPAHLHGAVAAMGTAVPGSDHTPSPPDCEVEPPLTGDPYARVRSGELSLRDLKKELERQCIERALAECDGNISKAAGVLGMKRPRLSQLVKEYGLSRRDEE